MNLQVCPKKSVKALSKTFPEAFLKLYPETFPESFNKTFPEAYLVPSSPGT